MVMSKILVPWFVLVSFGMSLIAIFPYTAIAEGGVTKKEQEIIDASVQWAYQNGLLKKTGVAIAKDAMITGRAMLKSGRVTIEEMERDTKGGGAEEYGLLVIQDMWNMTRTPTSKVLLAALSQRGAGETFVLDESLYERLVAKKIGFKELLSVAYSKPGNDPLLPSLLQQPMRLREQLLADGSLWLKVVSAYSDILADDLVNGVISQGDLSRAFP